MKDKDSKKDISYEEIRRNKYGREYEDWRIGQKQELYDIKRETKP